MIDAADTGRYERFDRDEWSKLRAQTPLTLSESDLNALRGINDRIDLDEVVAVYLPDSVTHSASVTFAAEATGT